MASLPVSVLLVCLFQITASTTVPTITTSLEPTTLVSGTTAAPAVSMSEIQLEASSVVRDVQPNTTLSYVAFQFRTCQSDGLLFVQQGPTGRFLWLSMIEGNLVSRWDLGDGTREYFDSVSNLADCQWHRVEVQLANSRIDVDIDGRTKGFAGTLLALTPVNNSIIGSVELEDRLDSSKLWNLQRPFVGCFRDLQFNSDSAPVVDFDSVNIEKVSYGCDTEQLQSSLPSEVDANSTATFKDGSYARFRRIDVLGSQITSLSENIDMFVRTREANGVIFYIGSDDRFILLQITNRNPVFAIKMGTNTQTTRLAATRSVADGEWHHIVAQRVNQQLILNIDDGKQLAQTSLNGPQGVFNLPDDKFVGGVPDFLPRPLELGTLSSWIGCIASPTFNGKQLEYDLASQTNELQLNGCFGDPDICEGVTCADTKIL
jgi:hypothetical protein